MERDDSFIRQRGNYKALLSYKKAECIYDITFYFAHRYLQKGDRTMDQMVQAARSGKQNIAEGCAAGATSRETELKLTNVAKASLQELLTDYEDYLRVRGMRRRGRDNAKFRQARAVCGRHNDSQFYRDAIIQRSDETIANIATVLICQADYLLFRQTERLKENFLKYGGIREEMSRARTEWRKKNR